MVAVQQQLDVAQQSVARLPEVEEQLTKLKNNYDVIVSKLGLGAEATTDEILDAINSFEEKRKNAVTALERKILDLETQNEELDTQVGESKAQIELLERQIEDMRKDRSVQTFGSLSGMFSSPAFKSAIIGIFTKFAGDQKRKTKEGYTEASNSNIRDTLPDKGPKRTGDSGNDLIALKNYYLDTLRTIAEKLKVNDSPIEAIADPNQINILANILKTISAPQPAGLYSLNDDQFNKGAELNELVTKLKTVNEPNYNSNEPVIYIPTKEELTKLKQGLISLEEGTYNAKQAIKTTLIKNFFSKNDTSMYVLYPSMKIGDEISYQQGKNEYIQHIDINLFEIKNNTVRFGRYLTDKVTAQSNNTNPGERLPTLGDLLNQDDKKPFFANYEGKLISRAEIIRIFIKSLLSALEEAWDLKAAFKTKKV